MDDIRYLGRAEFAVVSGITVDRIPDLEIESVMQDSDGVILTSS